MPQPFESQRALELAAALAEDAVSERDPAGVLERISAARAAAEGEPGAEALASLLASLARLAERAGAAAHLDDQTGLANRRGFDEAMRRAVVRAYHVAQPISTLSIGVDHFERLVEAGGAEAADRAVRLAADVIRGCLRHVDTAARVGPATFRVLLPGAGLDGAREVAERCRCAIAAAYLPETGALTATFGVATLPDHAANSAALLQAADAALGTGVRRGRNCVATALPLRQ
jgi:diguanylate cyclase (GGDEF)-like protein